MDCSLPDSSVYGIFQARVLEWVAISFSRGSSQPRDLTQVFSLQANSLPLSHLGSPLSVLGPSSKASQVVISLRLRTRFSRKKSFLSGDPPCPVSPESLLFF